MVGQLQSLKHTGSKKMAQVELVTDKYWQEVVKADKKRCRRARNRKAIDDLVAFLFGVAAIGLFAFAFQHQQTWVPIVENFFASL